MHSSKNNSVRPSLRQHACLGLSILMNLFASQALAEPKPGASAVFFVGQMTDNVWEETLQPWKIEFIQSGLLGFGLSYEWPTRFRNTTIGIEGQIVKHFGRQTNIEANLPLVLRYSPERPLIPAIDSFALGLGLSTTSRLPQTEIDRDGETSKTLVYWMAEMDFSLAREDTYLVFRLHHRSDAYGLFDTDSGANALVVGIRRRF